MNRLGKIRHPFVNLADADVALALALEEAGLKLLIPHVVEAALVASQEVPPIPTLLPSTPHPCDGPHLMPDLK